MFVKTDLQSEERLMNVYEKVAERAKELVCEVIDRRQLSFAEGGPMVTRLERLVNEMYYSCRKSAVAVSNCTVGLEMVFRALKKSTGRFPVVIVPANGMAAAPLAVLNAGCSVLFVDVDPVFGTISPEVLNELFNDKQYVEGLHLHRMFNAAVLLVHIGGRCEYEFEISKLCDEHMVPLIEDCAHVMGNLSIGEFGWANVFSMFATKVLPAGEGGVIMAKPPLYDVLKKMRMHGRYSEWSTTDGAGVNGKMSELCAAYGVAVLEHAHMIIDRRLRACHEYDRLALPAIGIWSAPGYKYLIHVPLAEKRKELEVAKCLSGPVFRVPLPDHPAFENCLKYGDYSGAKQFCETHVSLRTDVDVEKAVEIAGKVKEILES